jgi:hypothetical protein
VADAEVRTHVELAKRYPFEQPRTSYVYCSGESFELAGPDPGWTPAAEVFVGSSPVPIATVAASRGVSDAELAATRRPILAYGSNAAPETLERKFGGHGSGVLIPVVRARLRDFDVVYSAHCFRGWIPAGLQHSPGCAVHAYLLHLTDAELVRLHATEWLGRNYVFGRIEDIELEVGTGMTVNSVDTYLTLHGLLVDGDREIAVAGIRAERRTFGALSQVEVIDLVRDRLAPAAALDEFIAANMHETNFQRTTRALRDWSRPFAWSAWEPLGD